jgi:hypothetical protein
MARVRQPTLHRRRDEWIELGVIDELEERVLEAYDRITTKGTMCDHYTIRVLTPPLTPLRALHAETSGNHQRRKRLI